MDDLLDQPREREEADEEVRTPAQQPEARASAYVFDGWSYEPLLLAR